LSRENYTFGKDFFSPVFSMGLRSNKTARFRQRFVAFLPNRMSFPRLVWLSLFAGSICAVFAIFGFFPKRRGARRKHLDEEAQGLRPALPEAGR
jgi:hypothetical protein